MPPLLRHANMIRFAPVDRIGALFLHLIAVLLILSSHPFLKIPYDVWEHLIKIRSIFDEGRCFLYWPELGTTLCAWHHIWAFFFRLAGIDNVFVWARFIHWVQALMAYGSGYYFARTCLSLLFPEESRRKLCILAYTAAWLWLLGNGTRSEGYHHAWLLWYSVTYQAMAMAVYWTLLALTLLMFFRRSIGRLSSTGISLCIVLGLILLVLVHPIEAVFYSINLIILCLLNIRQLARLHGSILLTTLLALTGIGISAWLAIRYQWIPIPSQLAHLRFVTLLNYITTIGTLVAGGANRLRSSFSEIALFSLGLGLCWRLALWRWPIPILPRRCLDYLVITTWIFYLIPVTWPLAGVVGLFLPAEIIWRFFFGSPWFVLIPAGLLYACRWLKCHRPILHSMIASTVLYVGIVIGSHFWFGGATVRNARSLLDSLSGDRVGLQYSKQDLEAIRRAMQSAAADTATTGKSVMYYMRSDIGTLARAAFGAYVFNHRLGCPAERSFYDSGLERRYDLVNVPTPAGVARDPHIFQRFRLDKAELSKPVPRIGISMPAAAPLGTNGAFDTFIKDKQYVTIEGWSIFSSGATPRHTEHYLVLETARQRLIFSTSLRFQPDLKRRLGFDGAEQAAFYACIPLREVEPGTYRVGVYIKTQDRQQYYLSTHQLTITH